MAVAALGSGLICTGASSATRRNTVKVFILAGQSNMVGHGKVSHLEEVCNDPARADKFGKVRPGGRWVERDDVFIWFLGRKGRLTTGFAAGNDRIGPEFGFGLQMGDHFKNPVLLIKTAWGGKDIIKDFRPPSSGGEVGPYYKEMLQHVRDVLGDIKKHVPGYAGQGYEIAGFGWHQGWNDGCNMEACKEYETNLSNLIKDLRKELKVDRMPVVIANSGFGGRIERRPGDRRRMIIDAQGAVAKRAEFKGTVSCVDTQDFWRAPDQSPSKASYHWNHNAETYFLIGDAMGEAMKALLPKGGAPGIAGIDEKKLSSSLRSAYRTLKKGRIASAERSLARAEATARKRADAGSESAKADLKAIALLRAHIKASVDDLVANINRRMEAGDYFTASKLIKDNAMSMRGIATFEEAATPAKEKLATPDVKREILLGRSYFSLMDKLKKRRSSLSMKQLAQLGERHGDSLYGKAARSALEDLRDPDAKVDADKYLGIE